MADLNDWANLAADNDRTQLPDYMPEGATPVPMFNEWGREAQAAVRKFFESIEWRNFLSDSESPTFASGTTFTVPAAKQTLYVEDQRVRITNPDFTVNPDTGTITNVTGNTVTVEMDDAGSTLTANMTLVECGLSPEGLPITTAHINNFSGQVLTTVDSSGSFQRLLASTTISLTYVSATSFTVAGSDRFAFWPLARIDINGATPVTATVTSVTPGADPENDPATVVVVVDSAGVVGADATEAVHVTVNKDEGVVLDTNGQVRGAGYPMGLVGYEEVNLGTLVSGGSTTAHTLAVVPTFYTCVARATAAVHGFAIGDEVNLSGAWTADKDSGSGGNRADYGFTSWVNASVVGARSSGGDAKIRTPDNSTVSLDSNANYDIVFKLFTITTLATP